MNFLITSTLHKIAILAYFPLYCILFQKTFKVIYMYLFTTQKNENYKLMVDYKHSYHSLYLYKSKVLSKLRKNLQSFN